MWWAALLLQPHAVIVPGDMLDEGKLCDDEQHAQLLHRFKAVFMAGKTDRWRVTLPFSARTIPLILTPGNHDQPPPFPAGHPLDAALPARARSMAAFGSDSCTCVRGHVFHSIDTSGLFYDGQGGQGSGGRACEAVSCAPHGPTAPPGHQVVVTHAPLFRSSDIMCGKERGQGGGVTYVARDSALAEGQDVLSPSDGELLMQTAEAAAQLTGRRVSVVLSGHTHAPCFITSPAHSGAAGSAGSSGGVLHATLSASGWRIRPDASCALLLLHERAADGSIILQLPVPHEHLCIAVVAAAAALLAAVTCIMGRRTWRSFRWRHKAS